MRTRGGNATGACSAPLAPAVVASRTRTRPRAGNDSTRSTRPVTVTIAGLASTGAATLSARAQASAMPSAAVSIVIATARLRRSNRPSATAASPIAATPAIAAIHWPGPGNRNQAEIPAPKATGSQSGSWSRSFCKPFSNALRACKHPAASV